MTKQVRGYLASDKTFFESQPECQRYEFTMAIRAQCDSHGINPDNFFMCLREWSTNIKGYYDADSKCKQPEAKPTGTIAFEDLPSSDDDYEDAPVGDKDVPGFLEQQAGRYK